MKLRLLLWCLILAALFTGCRSNEFTHAWIEEMNNRNRELEDQAYELEYENEKLRRKLEQQPPGTTRPPSQPNSPAITPPRSNGNRPAGTPPAMTPDPEIPQIEIPMDPEPAPMPLPAAPVPAPDPEPAPAPAAPMIPPVLRDFGPAAVAPAPEPEPELAPPTPVVAAPRSVGPRRPAIDLSPPAPEPDDPPQPAEELPAAVESLPPPQQRNEPQPVVVPETTTGPVGRPAFIAPPPPPPKDLLSGLPSPEETVAAATNATRLAFNPEHTGGVDLDGQPGDDGLAILIEPHNEAGQYVPQLGKISVVVLDPAVEGAAARVARWDFDEEEVRGAQSVLAQQKGISLTMPWPEVGPQHATLRLYVRMETASGDKLQADQELIVTLPGQANVNAPRITPAETATPGERWTPRASHTLPPGEGRGEGLRSDQPAGEMARRPPPPNTAPNNPPLATPLPEPITPPPTIQEPKPAPEPPKRRMISPPPALGQP